MSQAQPPEDDKRGSQFLMFLMLGLCIWMMMRPAPPPAPTPKPPGEKSVKNEPKAGPERTRLAVGSLDPATGYSMLVTFDNRGGTIERIELAGDDFHEPDRAYGYIGELAATNAPGAAGAIVGVIGDATPAAKATSADFSGALQPGDRIVKLNDRDVADVRTLDQALQTTKPNQEIDVEIFRTVSEAESRGVFRLKTTQAPLSVVKPESNIYTKEAVAVEKQVSAALAKAKQSGADLPNDLPKPPEDGPGSFRLTLSELQSSYIKADAEEIGGLPSMHTSNWTTTAIDDGVEFAMTLDADDVKKAGAAGTVRVVKRYRLAKRGTGEAGKAPYQHVALEIEIENQGDAETKLGYRLDGPNGLPLEGWWYYVKMNPGWFAGAGARDVCYDVGDVHYMAGLPAVVDMAMKRRIEDKTPSMELAPTLANKQFQYLAVDAQYFAVALTPDNAPGNTAAKRPAFPVATAEALPLNEIDNKNRRRMTNVSFRLTSEQATLKPGEKLTHRYAIYAGPKDVDSLARYGLSSLIEFGWFGMFSRPLSAVLAGFHWLTGNYGVAIVLLTIAVRLAMLPLGIRQARQMSEMQAKLKSIEPELKKINEEYKNDWVKRGEATQVLHKKHGVASPLGGCLTALVQAPIFMGLYRCLSTDINMREAPLIPGIHWCSNLAGPDALFDWTKWMPAFVSSDADGWLGPVFNVLPLITIGLLIVQQKMFTPPAQNEEQAMQQKIANYMMVFMGVLWFKVQAGLCIYLIVSSLWGIIEKQLVTKPKTEAEIAALATAPAKPAEPRKPGWFEQFSDRVVKMVDKPKEAPAPERPSSERRKKKKR